MELRDLHTFVTVASLLNFNQSAKALHTAQSTVSVRIRVLEEELRTRLFDRLGRKVVLTPAGVKLLKFARKMVEIEEEARTSVGEESTAGVLTLRVPESLSVWRLPAVLRAYRKRCPKVRLRLLPCISGGLTEDLRQGVTDVSFVLAYEVVSRDMQSEFMGSEELVLVAAPDHPLCGKTRVGPEDLADHTLILSSSDCSYRRSFEAYLADAGRNPLVQMECDSVASAISYARAGLGLTILPKIAVRSEIDSGVLRILPLVEGPFETGALMLWHRDKWLSPTLLAFMDACRGHLYANRVRTPSPRRSRPG